MRKHSYSLRIREIGNKRFQTLKSAGKRTGKFRQRKEWEHKIIRKTPDLTLLDDSKLTIHLLEILNNKPLIPLFTTNFKRTFWDIQVNKNTLVELALDQGVIMANDATLLISEIEIELKEGKPSEIGKLVNLFLKTLPVNIEDRSKSSRGYKLYMI